MNQIHGHGSGSKQGNSGPEYEQNRRVLGNTGEVKLPVPGNTGAMGCGTVTETSAE